MTRYPALSLPWGDTVLPAALPGAHPAVVLVNARLQLPSARPAQLPALPSLPTYFPSRSKQALDGRGAAMAASASHWHSYLGVIVSRERQRLEHFQRAEDILLTLLEGVHAREPRFLVDYARNLEAFEFALCASEDAVTMEVPLRIDGDALRVLACRPGDTPAGHRPGLGTFCLEVPSPGTDLEDWTSTVDVMEWGDGARCLVPGKVLQHLKELLVSAIVRCQRLFLLQPGAYASMAFPRPGAASSTAGEASSVVVPVQTGWGVSPQVCGPPKASKSERAPCCALGQALPSAKEGEMQNYFLPSHDSRVILGHLHPGLMAPFLVGGSSVQGSPTPAVSPWRGFAQGLGMFGSP